MPIPCVSTDTTEMVLGTGLILLRLFLPKQSIFFAVFALLPEEQDKESAQFGTNSGSQQFDTFVQVMAM